MSRGGTGAPNSLGDVTPGGAQSGRQDSAQIRNNMSEAAPTPCVSVIVPIFH
jgi:hypothetical protein